MSNDCRAVTLLSSGKPVLLATWATGVDTASTGAAADMRNAVRLGMAIFAGILADNTAIGYPLID